MSRVPRIETVLRREKDLPRDPSNWLDTDLITFVHSNYSPVDASPLSDVIERNRLTPRALWYLQTDYEHLLAIAEEESLRDTLLNLAESVQPAVSPTTPRIRHVRRLSEDLARPPPPPPPPPPTPPSPEEPALEEDDDVAESVVSDWALDDDLDGDLDLAPAADDLAPLASVAEPERTFEGLGLDIGEQHVDNVTAPHPELPPTEPADLINLGDEPAHTTPQETPVTQTDVNATATPLAGQAIPPQGPSMDAHVPGAFEQESSADTLGADPHASSDEPHSSPSTSRDDGAGGTADPDPHGSSNASHIVDVDRWVDPTSEGDAAPPAPQTEDAARPASPISDYHDANSTHGDDGEHLPASHPEPETAAPAQTQPPHEQTASGNQEPVSTEEPVPVEEAISSETAAEEQHGEVPPNSGDGAPQSEEARLEVNPAPILSEERAEPAPPAAGPISAESVEETTQTQELNDSPSDDAENANGAQAHVSSDDLKDSQLHKELPVRTPSVPPSSEQLGPSGEAEDQATGDRNSEEALGNACEGEGAVKNIGEGEEDANKVGEGEGEEPAENVGEREETTEPIETTPSPAATSESADQPPATKGQSDSEGSGSQTHGQSSAPDTTPTSVQAEPEVEESSSQAQDEETLVPPSVSSETPATEANPSTTTTTEVTTTTQTTTTTATIDVPSSPTVKLKTGLDVMLVSRDPDSTEQTPSMSPSGTPPDASPSPSSSRQMSPPAEMGAQTTQAVAFTRIPSSSSSPNLSFVNATEKPPAPPRIQTDFRSSSEILQSPNFRTGNSASQRGPAWGSASTPSLGRSPAGQPQDHSSAPQAQSPAWAGPKKLFSSFASSVSHAFGTYSEPTTRNPSHERDQAALRTLPARQTSRAPPNVWQRPALNSSPAPAQQLQKSKPLPEPAPTSALEQSNDSSLASMLGSSGSQPTAPAPALTAAASPPEGSTGTPKPDSEFADSVLVDVGTPSVGNGEPSLKQETSEALPGQHSAPEGSSSTAGQADGQGDIEDIEDEGMVMVKAPVADGETGTGAQATPENGGEDDDDDLPLDRRLQRVRLATGDSLSSAFTSDTETPSPVEDDPPSRPRGPRVQTNDLPDESDGVGSPVVDSPAVGGQSGGPLTKSQKKRERAKKKAKKVIV